MREEENALLDSAVGKRENGGRGSRVEARINTACLSRNKKRGARIVR